MPGFAGVPELLVLALLFETSIWLAVVFERRWTIARETLSAGA